MSFLQKLFGQTIIYGISSVLARFLNFLLIPLYTRLFLPEESAIYVEFYAYIAFFIVILTFGMETAFFRHYEAELDRDITYSTSFWTVLGVNLVFLLMAFTLLKPIAIIIEHENNQHFIILSALIVSLDAVSSIPFAYLRAHKKAWRFAMIKTAGISMNIILNLILLLLFPFIYQQDPVSLKWFEFLCLDQPHVIHIFTANLMSSFFIMMLLIPELQRVKLKFSNHLFNKMIRYALPLLILGIAGIVNETIDRILLKFLLPPEVAMYQLGIYGMCYKLVIIVSICIQAFRYAAEPFFFEVYKQEDARKMYAELLSYFVLILSIIVVFMILFMDFVKYFVSPLYYEGLKVVPLLLYSHIFLGIVYNLSVWYKLTDKTIYGAFISTTGAIITILLNFLLIPIWGYVGSAIANFTCYFSMAILSYFLGQRHYRIPYPIHKIILFLILPIIYSLISLFMIGNYVSDMWIRMLINSFLLLTFLGFILMIEPSFKKFLIQWMSNLKLIKK
ncbi:MAG: oligosaccharide flippase family protein [Bacteroidales bacterium]|nr:oligosaccharide flippase family protein [Bacteroidales bacterium]